MNPFRFIMQNKKKNNKIDKNKFIWLIFVVRLATCFSFSYLFNFTRFRQRLRKKLAAFVDFIQLTRKFLCVCVCVCTLYTFRESRKKSNAIQRSKLAK